MLLSLFPCENLHRKYLDGPPQPSPKANAKYVARLAQSADEVRRAQRLRCEVFNLELNEGLVESHFIGLDVDPFDKVCDHLIVEHVATGEIVGTYRLQTGARAAANIGYYSEREFDFTPYEAMRGEMIELGRACVHADHRNLVVLHSLWRGIANYAVERKARFLIGCSSLTSQDPVEGAAMYEQLRKKYLVSPELPTVPLAEFALHPKATRGRVALQSSRERNGSAEQFRAKRFGVRGVFAPLSLTPPKPATGGASSKLLRAYLAIGAKICGPPAIDRDFGTIDFLTLLDIRALPAIVRAHFLG
jgi:putative hemolysin